MGRDELERLLRASDFGENEAMYRTYFRPGMPVRCIVCGETVRAHGDGAAMAVTNVDLSVQLG
jgi:hypothetical protein